MLEPGVQLVGGAPELPNREFSGDDEFDFLAVTLDQHLHGLACDAVGEVIEKADPMAVDSDDPVADLDTGLGGGTGRDHPLNNHRIVTEAETDDAL